MTKKHLFDASTINGMNLANRFVRSATWEGMATQDGQVTPQLTDSMVALAKGGVGLIISGHAYVTREGQASPWQLGLYDDSLIDGRRPDRGPVGPRRPLCSGKGHRHTARGRIELRRTGPDASDRTVRGRHPAS